MDKLGAIRQPDAQSDDFAAGLDRREHFFSRFGVTEGHGANCVGSRDLCQRAEVARKRSLEDVELDGEQADARHEENDHRRGQHHQRQLAPERQVAQVICGEHGGDHLRAWMMVAMLASLPLTLSPARSAASRLTSKRKVFSFRTKLIIPPRWANWSISPTVNTGACLRRSRISPTRSFCARPRKSI